MNLSMRHLRQIVAASLLMAATPGLAQESADPPAGTSPTIQAPVSSMTFPVLSLTFPGSVAAFTTANEGKSVRFTLNGDILFDFDKATLRPEADDILRQLAEDISSSMPGATLRIEGHTDAKGSNAYNDALSLRRAAAVKAWMAAKGRLSDATMSVVGFGKRHPAAANVKSDGSDDVEGRQRNRRVEVVATPH